MPPRRCPDDIPVGRMADMAVFGIAIPPQDPGWRQLDRSAGRQPQRGHCALHSAALDTPSCLRCHRSRPAWSGAWASRLGVTCGQRGEHGCGGTHPLAWVSIKQHVGSGETLRKGRKAGLEQHGGTVAPSSAHFTPAKRCNHQVPAGKTRLDSAPRHRRRRVYTVANGAAPPDRHAPD